MIQLFSAQQLFWVIQGLFSSHILLSHHVEVLKTQSGGGLAYGYRSQFLTCMRLHTCIIRAFLEGSFCIGYTFRNDFPSGQVGEAGACKAGGESHFGQGCGCLLRTYLLDIPKFMFKLLCLVQSGVGQGPSVARGQG